MTTILPKIKQSYFIISFQNNHPMCQNSSYSIFYPFRSRRQNLECHQNFKKCKMAIILPKIQQIISDHIYISLSYMLFETQKIMEIYPCFFEVSIHQNKLLWKLKLSGIYLHPVCSIQHYRVFHLKITQLKGCSLETVHIWPYVGKDKTRLRRRVLI